MVNFVSASISQTTVPVAPGTGTIEAAIAAITDPAVLQTTTFELQGGGVYILESTVERQDAGFTVAAADGSGARPIIKMRDRVVDDGACIYNT